MIKVDIEAWVHFRARHGRSPALARLDVAGEIDKGHVRDAHEARARNGPIIATILGNRRA